MEPKDKAKEYDELNDFYCNGDDGEYNNNRCLEQCAFCKSCEDLNKK
jgi:hypothetical protein